VKVSNTFWDRVLAEQQRDGRKVPELPRLPRRRPRTPKGTSSRTHSNAPRDDLRAQVLETIRANEKLEVE
jgi:hypothetical protein